jgi:hypothetical protein
MYQSIPETQKAAQVMTQNIQASTKLLEPRSIAAVINELAMRISSTEVNFERLADRLRPVRSTLPERTNSGDTLPALLPQCDLEGELLTLVDRIRALASYIDEVSVQVCV